MATFSETGHAKNVDNFSSLIANATSMGEKYNPTNPSIALTALSLKEKAARAAVDAVNVAMPAYAKACEERDSSFSEMDGLVTRVYNGLCASSSSDATDATAASIVRKIRGTRSSSSKAASKAAAAASAPKTVSVSQRSFDSQVDNFDRLVEFLAATPEYAPNEPELKLTALRTVATNLRTKNNACNAAKISLDSARDARNAELYEPTTGLVDVALTVKAYVKSLYGTASPEYKRVGAIEFRKAKL